MRSVRVGRTRRVVLAFLVLAGLGAVLVLQGEAGATLHQTSDTAPLGAVSTVWSRDLSRFDTDNPIAQSSPGVAMVDGTADAPLPAVVVGDRAGYLYAADLATGRLRTLYTSPAPIDSPPSAASPTGSGFDDVFFGRGNRGVACRLSDGTYGGYTAVSAAGTLLWKRWVNNPVGDTLCPHNGVMGGMTLFNDASGTLDTIGMSLVHHSPAGTRGSRLTRASRRQQLRTWASLRELSVSSRVVIQPPAWPTVAFTRTAVTSALSPPTVTAGRRASAEPSAATTPMPTVVRSWSRHLRLARSCPEARKASCLVRATSPPTVALLTESSR